MIAAAAIQLSCIERDGLGSADRPHQLIKPVQLCLPWADAKYGNPALAFDFQLIERFALEIG